METQVTIMEQVEELKSKLRVIASTSSQIRLRLSRPTAVSTDNPEKPLHVPPQTLEDALAEIATIIQSIEYDLNTVNSKLGASQVGHGQSQARVQVGSPA